MRLFGKRRAFEGIGARPIVPTIEIELAELSQRGSRLEQLGERFCSGGGLVYDMDLKSEKLRLARDLWRAPLGSSLIELRQANAALVAVLEAQIVNESKQTEMLIQNKARLVDGMLLNICRAQSQKKIPLLSAAFGVLSEVNHVAREYHDCLAMYFKGAAVSEKWVHDFMRDYARDARPLPLEPCLAGILVATFDNLSMNVNYQSYVKEGEGGYKLDMTNWFTTGIPRFLAPPGFDAARIAREGIFRTDISLSRFCRLFYSNHGEIVGNRRMRWERYMRAAANGRLLDRPQVEPTWTPYKVYQEPMFGRLQSSYTDVEYELS
jgi:hypothetical protein